MPLKALQIQAAKPSDKPYKLADGGGLYLEIAPSGGKWWRFKYRFAGKENRLSLGTFPSVTLQDARERRDDARRLLLDGIDPSQHRKATKASAIQRAANSFEAVAREWFAKFSPGWASGHADKIIQRLERDVFPWLGGRPIAEIAAPELLATLRRIKARGALETARRFSLVGDYTTKFNAQQSAVGRFHFYFPQTTRGSRPFCVCHGCVPPDPKVWNWPRHSDFDGQILSRVRIPDQTGR